MISYVQINWDLKIIARVEKQTERKLGFFLYLFLCRGMDFSRQPSISQAKDVQIEDSWIPATPAKPGATKPQPICKENQEIQPSKAYLSEFEKFLQEKAAEEAGVLELERFSSGSSEETEGQVSIWGSSNSSGGKRGFNSMEEAVATNSQLLGDNVGVYKDIPTYVEETMLNNMPFSDLLKLVGNESASVSGSSFVHSSPIDICLSLGSSFQSSSIPGTPQCECHELLPFLICPV